MTYFVAALSLSGAEIKTTSLIFCERARTGTHGLSPTQFRNETGILICYFDIFFLCVIVEYHTTTMAINKRIRFVANAKTFLRLCYMQCTDAVRMILSRSRMCVFNVRCKDTNIIELGDTCYEVGDRHVASVHVGDIHIYGVQLEYEYKVS